MRAFGRFTLTKVDAGRYWVDAGALFGIVPKPLWQRFATADELNRVELALRPLLVLDDTPGARRRVLIDTGIGDKVPAKRREQLRLASPEGGIREAVRRAGCDPREVTDVVLTHLHSDHAGGSTRRNERGELVPTFENATYHVQRRAWKWAHAPTERDHASFDEADFAPLAGAGCLHLLDGPEELLPGFVLMLSEGHTPALQLPLIDGAESGKLLFCGDVIPTRAHLRLNWIMAYDMNPLTTLEEKRLLLAQALEEGWTLFLEHDPNCCACHLTEQEGKVIGCDGKMFG